MNNQLKLFFFLTFGLVTIHHVVLGGSPQRCIYVMNEDFQKCGNRVDEKITFQELKLNRIYNLSDPVEPECQGTTNPCRRIFKVSRIMRQSFGTKTLVQISDMLRRCCGQCTKYHRNDITIPLSQINMTQLRNTDIVFPVPSASSVVTELHGFHFVPLFDTPSAFYLTLRMSDKERTLDMIDGCLRNWPLLIICLLLALIAGFLGWIIETWQNKEQFPREFHRGLWEGFWWSFISMTTVGYGDKCPKSFVARIFSVFWILVGITMTSIYIAKLSSHIISAQEHEEPEMSGRQVGTLRNALHDSIMIAQHGGIVRTVDFNNTVMGILHMVDMMERGEIDGFLITRPIYYYFAREIEEKEQYSEHKRHIDALRLVRTEKTFRYGNMATGMMVRRQEDYDFFGRYFESNWLQIQGCYMTNLNYKEKKFQISHPDLMIGLFYPFLAGALGIVGAVLLFGGLYEARRRLAKRRMKQKMAGEGDCNGDVGHQNQGIAN